MTLGYPHKAERSISMTMQPYAVCQGKSDDEPCRQEWEQAESGTTRQSAKTHVKLTGHKVLVVTETRDLYVPAD